MEPPSRIEKTRKELSDICERLGIEMPVKKVDAPELSKGYKPIGYLELKDNKKTYK